MHLAYGTVTAALLAFPVVDLLSGRPPAQPAAVALVMAPLVLSLGVADWLVHRLRSGAWDALQDCDSLPAFRAVTEALLLVAVARYAAVLATLTAGVALGARAGRVLVVDAAAFALLGVALLLGSLLVSLGRTQGALAATSVALALDTALGTVLPDRLGDGWATAHHALVLGALVLVLLPVARSEFGTVTRHR